MDEETTNSDGPPPPRLSRFEFIAIVVVSIMMLIGLFALPDRQGPLEFWGYVGFFVGLGILTCGIVLMSLREIKHEAHRDVRLRIITVFVLMVASIEFFSLCFYRLAHVPNEIVDLNTRLDALYFTMSTTMTVGFGDVHASGQMGRFVVLVQLVFNIGILAMAARLLNVLFRQHRGAKTPT